jgi:hypothetical protein
LLEEFNLTKKMDECVSVMFTREETTLGAKAEVLSLRKKMQLLGQEHCQKEGNLEVYLEIIKIGISSTLEKQSMTSSCEQGSLRISSIFSESQF